MEHSGDLFQLSNRVLNLASSLGLRTDEAGGRILASRTDPMTTPDEVIQNVVLEWVRSNGSGWGVISEEGRVEKGDGEKDLYLDPLDGSHNARDRIPFYSTSLALFDIRSGDLTHAIVIDIPFGRIYHSQRNGGSYYGTDKLHVRERPLGSCAFSAYIGPESNADHLGLMRKAKRTRYLGCDSLEMCLVARGSLDGTLYFGRLPRKTDIAASILIVREAGGEVFSVRTGGISEPLDIGKPWEGLKGIISLGWPDNLQMLLLPNNDERIGNKGDGGS